MRTDHIKKAAGYAGKSLAELARESGQTSPANFHSKLRRETLKDEELEEIARVLGCKYRCYFEFPDGTKIGEWKE